MRRLTALRAASCASTTAAAWRSACRERRLGVAIAIVPSVIVMARAVGRVLPKLTSDCSPELIRCRVHNHLKIARTLFVRSLRSTNHQLVCLLLLFALACVCLAGRSACGRPVAGATPKIRERSAAGGAEQILWEFDRAIPISVRHFMSSIWTSEEYSYKTFRMLDCPKHP
jgi:hypothetical protein